MTEEEREFRQARFIEIVSSPDLRSRVFAHVSFMTGPGEPAVTEADRQAARPYLQRCMERMSMDELTTKEDDELVALWARGTLGAARYRLRGRPGSRARASGESE